MIALDTNILVYSHRRESPFHSAAAKLVKSLAEGTVSWAIPWPCVHEFLAIVTHPRIYQPPTPTSQATAQVGAWLESPSIALLGETADHFAQLQEMLERTSVVGSAIHDAKIAAICASHGVSKLYSADRDFSRFRGLQVENPLL